VAGAALVETHTAIVVFVGDRAYKVKKPVALGFLDFSTLDARHRACEREVALNRRLAPDVYLGVAEIRDPQGAPCEYAVVMRRMPEDRRLTACLARGDDVRPALWRVAHQLASLHAASDPSRAPEGVADVATVGQRWDDNFAAVRPLAGRVDGGAVFDAGVAERVEQLVHRYLDGRAELFDRRIRDGRVRDGHGDLQADDIFVLGDGPRVLDCLEFDDRLRWDDELDDVAFLAMDLERLGHADLASAFLGWHRELSGDAWPASLAHHYVAYRAHIRAKVNAIRYTQGDAPSAAAARGLLDLAAEHLEAARVRLVLVGGLPGTGKSTVAAALGDELGYPVLRTDDLRGLDADRAAARAAPGGRPRYGEGRYRPELVDATYDRLLDEAAELLRMGEPVILDASWSAADRRARARATAAREVADVVELRCVAPADVAAARIRARLAEGADASEATPEIASAMTAVFDPWPEAHEIDTTGSVADAVAACCDHVRRART